MSCLTTSVRHWGYEKRTKRVLARKQTCFLPLPHHFPRRVGNCRLGLSIRRPRIEQRHPHVFEIPDIACGQGEAVP